MSWWESAYDSSSQLIQERFAIEAASSLPGVLPSITGLDSCSADDLDSCFEAAIAKRTKLRYDRQVPE